MKKFITKQDLENSKPKEPTYLRWRIAFGLFLMCTLILVPIFMLFMFLIIKDINPDISNTRIVLGFLSLPYLMTLLFGSLWVMEKNPSIIFNFIKKWIGLYTYTNELYDYHTLLIEYNLQQSYLELHKSYKDYE